MENKIKTSQARDEFGTIVNRVAYGKEHFILVRRNREMAAIIPMEEYELLEEYIAKLEDALDLNAAEEALSEPGENIPFEQVRKKLGLDALPDRAAPGRKARAGKAAKG